METNCHYCMLRSEIEVHSDKNVGKAVSVKFCLHIVRAPEGVFACVRVPANLRSSEGVRVLICKWPILGNVCSLVLIVSDELCVIVMVMCAYVHVCQCPCKREPGHACLVTYLYSEVQEYRAQLINKPLLF